MSHPTNSLHTSKGDNMDQTVPDPVAKAIADEMARSQAAADWAALVKECAARGDA